MGTLNLSGRVPSTNEIKHVLECKMCALTCPAGMDIHDWQDVTIGFTPYGLQMWCRRHQMNIFHADFRGSRVAFNVQAKQGVIWPGIQ